MTTIELLSKVKRRLFSALCFALFQLPRIFKYRLISSCTHVEGTPIRSQPVLIEGIGKVCFAGKVHLGVRLSPHYYSGYIYIDVRKTSSKVCFGSNIWINNNCVFVSEGEGIEIGDNTLIGTNCEFVDSDFHDLDPACRMGGNIKTAKVTIGKNVFIGSNVKVLKGVVIGDNSVISNGSIVVKSIPSNVVAGGVPAKMIKTL